MENEEAVFIDLQHVLDILKKYWLIFTLIIIACGCFFGIFTKYFVDKTYTAVGKIIVVKQADSNLTLDSLTYSDIQLSQKLVDTYSEIMKSEVISDAVIKNLNLQISNATYNQMVTVSSVNDTEVIVISVESLDPELSAKMANMIIEVFIDKIYDIMNINNVSVLNNAKIPTSASGPSIMLNIIIGIMIGLVLCTVYIFYSLLTDNKVKTEEELKTIFDYPIIGKIPLLAEMDVRESRGKKNEQA
ncbi:putative capsular polysaccharide biosynthesis protein YwqC [bioreactor metagenome]|uniref:Putative capsular polysaccharide biosynthesis protein YwqC n=1 Tax=bioreactor metagenome TaxID=1076179 RepID=A0A645ECK1_9ZZZZ|nr:Wzz/FepE/Etk N-terminal domain-containing protein [Erysipelotrichaceae bacterium]